MNGLTRVGALLAIQLLITSAAFAETTPLLKKLLGSDGTLSEKIFTETITKLNGFPQFTFIEAYKNDSTWAYYSGKNRTSCWLKRHESDELADALTAEIAEHKYPVFRYANWVGYCLAGDTEELATKVRYILIGAGQWKE